MVATLRSCCRIAAPVGGSAAWPTSEEPARIAMRAAQNGTVQRVSRRSAEDVIGASHDSTAEMVRRGAAGVAPRRADDDDSPQLLRNRSCGMPAAAKIWSREA